MKVPSFLRMRRTRSLQSPSESSSSDASSPSSSSSSSELSSPPLGRRGKEAVTLERKALSLPKSSTSSSSASSASSASLSSSSSFASWMWRRTQSKRNMSGELFFSGKPRSRNTSRELSRELCVPAAALPQFSDDAATSELAEVFRYFDRNGVGKISAVELGHVLCSLGIENTDDELEMMVKEVDADGDGFIDLEEFINLNRLASEAITAAAAIAAAGDGMEKNKNNKNKKSSSASSLSLSSEEEVLRDAFHVFDVEKKGYISADALHRILSGLGEECVTLEDCRRMLNSVDQDGDGRVDFNDFRQMMHGGGGNLVC